MIADVASLQNTTCAAGNPASLRSLIMLNQLVCLPKVSLQGMSPGLDQRVTCWPATLTQCGGPAGQLLGLGCLTY